MYTTQCPPLPPSRYVAMLAGLVLGRAVHAVDGIVDVAPSFFCGFSLGLVLDLPKAPKAVRGPVTANFVFRGKLFIFRVTFYVKGMYLLFIRALGEVVPFVVLAMSLAVPARLLVFAGD